MAGFIAASFVRWHTERPITHTGELFLLSWRVSEEKKKWNWSRIWCPNIFSHCRSQYSSLWWFHKSFGWTVLLELLIPLSHDCRRGFSRKAPRSRKMAWQGWASLWSCSSGFLHPLRLPFYLPPILPFELHVCLTLPEFAKILILGIISRLRGCA